MVFRLVLLFAAFALIVAGVALIHPPSAFIVSGVLAGAGALLYEDRPQ